jgi:hypothetical protein
MDRLYATELSEGGTRALGSGVPGITRDQLSVLSLSDWQKRKDEMAPEGWASREKAGGGACSTACKETQK